MEKRTRNLRVVGRDEVSLSELIHQAIRKTIEQAVEEELHATLGAAPYERHAERSGYRNGTKTRTLTGPTGPVELTLPGGRLATSDTGTEEWRSTVVPRYQRRMREVNEAVAGVYLSGGNTRRIRGALRPLLKNAPLSKSAVSRIVGTLRGEWEAWSSSRSPTSTSCTCTSTRSRCACAPPAASPACPCWPASPSSATGPSGS